MLAFPLVIHESPAFPLLFHECPAFPTPSSRESRIPTPFSRESRIPTPFSRVSRLPHSFFTSVPPFHSFFTRVPHSRLLSSLQSRISFSFRPIQHLCPNFGESRFRVAIKSRILLTFSESCTVFWSCSWAT